MRGEAAGTSSELARLRAVERSLILVRWFGVVFGAFQISQTHGPPEPPAYFFPGGYASIAALAIGNILITRFAGRTRDVSSFRRIGYAGFSLDMAVILANVWLDSYAPNSTSWTLAFVLPLEGAIRYQMVGAVASIGAFAVSEAVREWYLLSLFDDHVVEISAVTFRVGLLAIIAFVAGLMARNLERERHAAESRADELELMARREATARNEIEAFHDVVLAGIGSGTLSDTLAEVASVMGRAFGWEAFAIGVVDDADGSVKLIGSYGFPPSIIDQTMPKGQGIVGRAIRTGQTQLLCDARSDPDYVEWNPLVRSEMTAPIRFEGKIIGVVDVEAREESRFTDEDVARLERLADQIGLVISNARLLAAERAMVERLQELDTMKSDFVAVTSHELRTPLTAVQGFIRTIRRSDVHLNPGEIEEFLAIVDRQVERLSRLVEDLLLTARIDAGAIDLRMDSVDVSDVLEETLVELGDGRARVQLAIDPSLPRIVTDAQRLGQVARNLIENALKYSGEDQPVRVTAVRDGNALLIEVADRGAGISEDELPNVFDRFHQVGGSLRRRRQGLGLGLYIVRNLVEALNGSVRVRSTVGEGTTFSIGIPLVPASVRSSSA